ncbi:MAG TPA: phosphotransferase [Pyrinomonadaceae bacterium]|nr:phosphotransferase [Pyrinomonadaceae bacterium]
MSDFLSRLEQFLDTRGESSKIEQLTPDASTREYFRISWKNGRAIACVYPEPFIAAEQSYLDVTSLFQSCGLPVARVLEYDEELGVIVIEDFGDLILRDELGIADADRREALIDQAIDLIPRIQVATQAAFDTDSIASRLKFDAEKLNWELDFFKTHYFTTFKKQPLDAAADAALVEEFNQISEELESKATVLCHRDFHAANLMLDQGGELRIIDHQDARIGSLAYDLVSLLLDRVTEPPTAEWLAIKRRRFLAGREKLGLASIDEAAFTDEFRLQTIQRCLKAVGTFSFQSANRGKTYFVPFITPMFQIVLRAVDNIGRFPALRSILESELK